MATKKAAPSKFMMGNTDYWGAVILKLQRLARTLLGERLRSLASSRSRRVPSRAMSLGVQERRLGLGFGMPSFERRCSTAVLVRRVFLATASVGRRLKRRSSSLVQGRATGAGFS